MPQKSSFLIAIDGPNASGKGTLARRLGAELGFPVLDTGLLYRAVAWLVLQEKGDISHENTALHAADALHDLLSPTFLANPELRSAETGNAASVVSAHPPVRQSLFDLQRNFALHPPGSAQGAILDGRDIGTVICPDADIKLYVTAKPEIRAERRARELYGDNWQSQFDDMLEKTIERDKRDSERPIAPLKPAADAVMIDTSDFNADQTFALALETIRKKYENSGFKP